MIEPNADHHTIQKGATDGDDALKHFAWGLVPAAIAGIALLVHALDPVVPERHQPVFFTIVAMIGNGTLAFWIWCTVKSIRHHSERRHDAQDAVIAETDRTVARIDRSMQALHKKLDGLTAEVEHLQRLLLEDNSMPINAQRGPRSLS